jgi:ubiquitin C-terminal hydrolase
MTGNFDWKYILAFLLVYGFLLLSSHFEQLTRRLECETCERTTIFAPYEVLGTGVVISHLM